MADEPVNYTLRVEANEYVVWRKGTECTINVPMSFFSPRRDSEHTGPWVRRVSWLLYLDLNKVPLIKSVSISTTRKVIIIRMDRLEDWNKIAHDVRDAFSAHLNRKAKGDYER